MRWMSCGLTHLGGDGDTYRATATRFAQDSATESRGARMRHRPSRFVLALGLLGDLRRAALAACLGYSIRPARIRPSANISRSVVRR